MPVSEVRDVDVIPTCVRTRVANANDRSLPTDKGPHGLPAEQNSHVFTNPDWAPTQPAILKLVEQIPPYELDAFLETNGKPMQNPLVKEFLEKRKWVTAPAP